MSAQVPRIWSPGKARWLLNHYPPWWFQRIRVVELADDFRVARVLVPRSLLTRNLNGTTFGGTIFSAADPLYPVMYWQIFARRGERLQVWLKAGRIDYRKPAATALTLEFRLRPDDLEAVAADLAAAGKSVREHHIAAVDAAGDVCAAVDAVVYLRRLRPDQMEVSGF
ncbi:MAG: DUF4442 domain-containing protein [Planctomycetota bacterium]|nr:MAG: DUF4442 domain-containing protein [Planctomycetota bacterium]